MKSENDFFIKTIMCAFAMICLIASIPLAIHFNNIDVFYNVSGGVATIFFLSYLWGIWD